MPSTNGHVKLIHGDAIQVGHTVDLEDHPVASDNINGICWHVLVIVGLVPAVE